MKAETPKKTVITGFNEDKQNYQLTLSEYIYAAVYAG